ncbi:MAG: DUF1292 domain-containing protein [Coprococcus sp.]|nr:DUF1292 domain-containing protein [Coprococcus sp.]
MKENKILFETEDGDKAEFSVLEQTTLGGINYLLVADDADEEGTFLVLKEDNDINSNEMVTFNIVEDERELEAVVKIFDELLEDVDLEV